jgi:hypothetical protein
MGTRCPASLPLVPAVRQLKDAVLAFSCATSFADGTYEMIPADIVGAKRDDWSYVTRKRPQGYLAYRDERVHAGEEGDADARRREKHTGRMRMERGLTTRNLPYATLMNSEFILVHLDLHCARLHVEHHMHFARVLCALHLVYAKVDNAPIEEVSCGGKLRVLERTVWDILGLYTFLCPRDIWKERLDTDIAQWKSGASYCLR